MPILSSIFSIGAPTKGVDYSPIIKLLDDINLRKEKERELDQKLRSEANEIALKFGADIKGLPNDMDFTRDAFEKTYNNFKSTYQQFESAGRSADFFGSFQYLDLVNDLQQVNDQNNKNLLRQEEWKNASNIVQSKGTGQNISYTAIFDAAHGTNSLIQPKEKYSGNELTFQGLLESYSRDPAYAGKSMASMSTESTVDPKGAIQFLYGLLSIVGSRESDNLPELIKNYINTSTNVDDATKKNINEFILTQTKTNAPNLISWKNAINSGALFSPDMENNIKNAMANEYVKILSPTGYNTPIKNYSKDQLKEVVKYVEDNYKDHLSDTVTRIAKINLQESIQNQTPKKLGADDDSNENANIWESYVSTALNSANTNSNTSNPHVINTKDEFSLNFINWSLTAVPPELNNKVKGTSINLTQADGININLSRSYKEQTDGTYTPVYGDAIMYRVIAPTSDVFEYFKSTGEDIEGYFTDEVIGLLNRYNSSDATGTINELKAGFGTYNKTGNQEDLQYWNNSEILVSDVNLAAMAVAGAYHTNVKDDYTDVNGKRKEYGYNSFVSFISTYDNMAAMPVVDYAGTQYGNTVRNLLEQKIIEKDKADELLKKIKTTTEYISIKNDKDKVNQYITELKTNLMQAMPKEHTPIWSYYSEKAGKKIGMDDIARIMGATPSTDKDGYYALSAEIKVNDLTSSFYQTTTPKKKVP